MSGAQLLLERGPRSCRSARTACSIWRSPFDESTYLIACLRDRRRRVERGRWPSSAPPFSIGSTRLAWPTRTRRRTGRARRSGSSQTSLPSTVSFATMRSNCAIVGTLAITGTLPVRTSTGRPSMPSAARQREQQADLVALIGVLVLQHELGRVRLVAGRSRAAGRRCGCRARRTRTASSALSVSDFASATTRSASALRGRRRRGGHRARRKRSATGSSTFCQLGWKP